MVSNRSETTFKVADFSEISGKKSIHEKRFELHKRLEHCRVHPIMSGPRNREAITLPSLWGGSDRRSGEGLARHQASILARPSPS